MSSYEKCGITTMRRANMNQHMQHKHDATYKDEKIYLLELSALWWPRGAIVKVKNKI